MPKANVTFEDVGVTVTMPAECRLACRSVIRDEDIVVEYPSR